MGEILTGAARVVIDDGAGGWRPVGFVGDGVDFASCTSPGGDLEVSITNYTSSSEAASSSGPGEPCESCGTRISVQDPMAAMRELVGLPPRGRDGRMWCEQRTTSWPGRLVVQIRPHSRERCRRVRAGDPEPWTDPEDDEEQG